MDQKLGSVVVVTNCAFHPCYRGDTTRLMSLLRLLESYLERDVHVLQVSNTTADQVRAGLPPELNCNWHPVMLPEPSSPFDFNGWCPSGLEDIVRLLVADVRATSVIAQPSFFARSMTLLPTDVQRVVIVDDLFFRKAKSYKGAGMPYDWVDPTPSAELAALATAHLVLCIQEEEQLLVRSALPRTLVELLPPLFDCVECIDASNETILLFGNSYDAQVASARWFLEFCLPTISRQVPSLSLLVRGRLASALDYCAHEQVGETRDLRSLYEATSVVINPILCGSGLKIKSAEALAHGRCLVSTRAGLQGIRSQDQVALCSDNAMEFARLVVLALTDKETRVRVARAAFEYAAGRYSYDQAASKLQHLLR